MTPRDLDPDALRQAAIALSPSEWEANFHGDDCERCLEFRTKQLAIASRVARAYLNALGLVMVPELKTGVPGKGEA